ncbi:hypothetical protein ACXZ71_00890 [Streptococcus agalactiae]
MTTREKQARSSVSQLTRNMMIIDLMKQTGWSRERVVNALDWMEAEKTIQFADNGNFNIRIFEG